MKKYSLCITTYNRYDLLLESFAQVINDERIEEIIISDDGSDQDYVDALLELQNEPDKSKYKKIMLWMYGGNRGMYVNKMQCMGHAKNDWVIILDSDNVIHKDYLDALDEIDLDPKTIYAPDFAYPNFDFRPFSGNTYDVNNIQELLSYPMGNVLANCCNYVINKNNLPYLYDKSIKGADSIYMLYTFIKAGYSLHVTKGLQYFHRVHSQSGFMADYEENMAKAREIKELMLNLQ